MNVTKVFVVEETIDWEAGCILGIFSTHEKATSFVDKTITRINESLESEDYKYHPVIDRVDIWRGGNCLLTINSYYVDEYE